MEWKGKEKKSKVRFIVKEGKWCFAFTVLLFICLYLWLFKGGNNSSVLLEASLPLSPGGDLQPPAELVETKQKMKEYVKILEDKVVSLEEENEKTKGELSELIKMLEQNSVEKEAFIKQIAELEAEFIQKREDLLFQIKISDEQVKFLSQEREKFLSYLEQTHQEQQEKDALTQQQQNQDELDSIPNKDQDTQTVPRESITDELEEQIRKDIRQELNQEKLSIIQNQFYNSSSSNILNRNRVLVTGTCHSGLKTLQQLFSSAGYDFGPLLPSSSALSFRPPVSFPASSSHNTHFSPFTNVGLYLSNSHGAFSFQYLPFSTIVHQIRHPLSTINSILSTFTSSDYTLLHLLISKTSIEKYLTNFNDKEGNSNNKENEKKLMVALYWIEYNQYLEKYAKKRIQYENYIQNDYGIAATNLCLELELEECQSKTFQMNEDAVENENTILNEYLSLDSLKEIQEINNEVYESLIDLMKKYGYQEDQIEEEGTEMKEIRKTMEEKRKKEREEASSGRKGQTKGRVRGRGEAEEVLEREKKRRDLLRDLKNRLAAEGRLKSETREKMIVEKGERKWEKVAGTIGKGKGTGTGGKGSTIGKGTGGIGTKGLGTTGGIGGGIGAKGKQDKSAATANEAEAKRRALAFDRNKRLKNELNKKRDL